LFFKKEKEDVMNIICNHCNGYTPAPRTATLDFLPDFFEKRKYKIPDFFTEYRCNRVVAAILLGGIKKCSKCGKEFEWIELPYSKEVQKILGTIIADNILVKCNDSRYMMPEWVCIHGYRGQPTNPIGY
jgi:hypothetical protein